MDRLRKQFNENKYSEPLNLADTERFRLQAGSLKSTILSKILPALGRTLIVEA